MTKQNQISLIPYFFKNRKFDKRIYFSINLLLCPDLQSILQKMSEQSFCEPYMPEQKNSYRNKPKGQVEINSNGFNRRKESRSHRQKLTYDLSTAKMIILRYKRKKQKENKEIYQPHPAQTFPNTIPDSINMPENMDVNKALFFNQEWYRYYITYNYLPLYLI